MSGHLDALVRELADAVKGNADDLPVRLRKAVVHAQSPLTVRIGGSTVPVPAQATGGTPAVGAVVWVMESGPRRILLNAFPVQVADSVQRIAGRPAADPPSTYPTGFSIMAPGTAAGWPTGFPVVHTTKYGTDVAQEVYGIVAHDTYYRYANSGADGWTSFRRRVQYNDGAPNNLTIPGHMTASQGFSANADVQSTLRRDTTATVWHSASPLLIENATIGAKIGFHQPGKVASSFGEINGSEDFRTYSNAGDDWRGMDCNWFARRGGRGWENQGNLHPGHPINQSCSTTHHNADYRYLANRHSGSYEIPPGTFGMPDGNWWLIQVNRHTNAGNNYVNMLASRMTAGRSGLYLNHAEGGNGTDAGTVDPAVTSHSGWVLIGG